MAQRKEWIVEIIDGRKLPNGDLVWVAFPEEWYAPCSRIYRPVIGMTPRTFHGVVRQMKELIRRNFVYPIVKIVDLRDARLRNVNTNEVIPWAIMGF